VIELGEAALARFLAGKGRIPEKQSEKLASSLVPVAQRALGLQGLLDQDQEMELERQHAGELVRQIESLEQWIASKESEIREAYDRADPNGYVMSIPGVGENTAPSLLSSFGESERFETSRKAQGFVGLFPESDASGDSDRKGTSLTKRGPAGLRRDLFLVADHFRRNDPQGALLYHDQMVHRGKHHNSALCVVANRLVIPRILAVVKEQRAYEYRDLDGNRITKEEARELVSELRVQRRGASAASQPEVGRSEAPGERAVQSDERARGSSKAGRLPARRA
ncbi:MAG: transposase, partial [Vicinamibacteria bacterium]